MSSSSSSRSSVNPEGFDARGDGNADDTAALQRCIDAAGHDAKVELRTGAIYRIDTNYDPTHGQFGGLKIRSGTVLSLNGAELKALPSSHSQGCVLNAYLANDWQILGPGSITGERNIHLGTGGEWGMGLACWAARNWQIGPDVEIANCWGDGIYLGYSKRGADFCENYRIEQALIHDCRRCGIGHVAGRSGRIVAVEIHAIHGTGPAAGIDFESDFVQHWNRDIVVQRARIYDCEIGIDVSTSNENITITGCSISAENSGIIIGRPASNIAIVDNPLIKSSAGGREGAALRTVVYGASAQVSNVRIVGNHFYGGGGFVLDVVGQGYRDFIVEGNELHASNPGVQGVARLGSVTFVGNNCVIEAAAGKSGDYFLYIAGGSYGRNEYANRSGKPMHFISMRSQDLGGDRYDSGNLTHVSTR